MSASPRGRSLAGAPPPHYISAEQDITACVRTTRVTGTATPIQRANCSKLSKGPFSLSLSARKAEGQGTTICITRYKRQHKLLLPLLLAGNCEQEPVAPGVEQGTSHSTRETTGRGDKCMSQSLLSSSRTWCPGSWGWPAGPQGVPPPQAGAPHWVQPAALGQGCSQGTALHCNVPAAPPCQLPAHATQHPERGRPGPAVPAPAAARGARLMYGASRAGPVIYCSHTSANAAAPAMCYCNTSLAGQAAGPRIRQVPFIRAFNSPALNFPSLPRK